MARKEKTALPLPVRYQMRYPRRPANIPLVLLFEVSTHKGDPILHPPRFRHDQLTRQFQPYFMYTIKVRNTRMSSLEILNCLQWSVLQYVIVRPGMLKHCVVQPGIEIPDSRLGGRHRLPILRRVMPLFGC